MTLLRSPLPIAYLDPTIDETVSVREAQILCGVSRRTIHNWMQKDLVKFVRLAGGMPRIYKKTLFRQDNPYPQKISNLKAK